LRSDRITKAALANVVNDPPIDCIASLRAAGIAQNGVVRLGG
jgi:hypothetical protein